MALVSSDRRTAAFLDTAHRIGRELVAGAIWDGDRCNWVGAMPEEGRHGNVVMAYAALGPDLYGGTSGIALFLAHLAAASGDDDVGRAARAAARQAVSRVEGPGPSSPSVYTGWSGIALAAAEIGRLLGDGELANRAAELVDREVASDESAEFDLLLGQAGGLVGLLLLDRVLGQRRLHKRAARLGEELLRRGKRTGGRLSWSSGAVPGRHHLTGFSHGASGAGYALLELADATGDDAYRRAARDAFAYERHVFDSREQNWPDFRSSNLSRTRRERPSFATFWCHGAPGISLARLRAYELLGDATGRQEAETALATTKRAVLTSLRGHAGNFSLCHGLAGNAEAFLEAGRALGPDGQSWTEVAMEVAEAGIERYAKSGHSWPCGARGGRTPSLFVGLAGIGLFYLRLACPSVPSVLLLRREAFGPE